VAGELVVRWGKLGDRNLKAATFRPQDVEAIENIARQIDRHAASGLIFSSTESQIARVGWILHDLKAQGIPYEWYCGVPDVAKTALVLRCGDSIFESVVLGDVNELNPYEFQL